MRFLYSSGNVDLFNAPAETHYPANTPHARCAYAKYVLMLGAFAVLCCKFKALQKALKTMCLLNTDGKASFLQFLSSVVGPFHKPLRLAPHQRSRRLQSGGGKEGREKTPAHVFEGVEAKRKLEQYLLELKQHKDHFLYCWKHLDICTNLINARMWLLFVLSQLFLRRRYCTDVSIIPC